MRSYRAGGAVRRQRARLFQNCSELAPKGARRISANPHANGGAAAQAARRCRTFATTRSTVSKPGVSYASADAMCSAQFLRDVMRDNMTNFRVFGPDETASNGCRPSTRRARRRGSRRYKPEDADGGELAPDGRVMEMLSEHTLEGWLEGYVLTGRHGFFATYEAFVHIIDSMFNQHAKWLEKCKTRAATGGSRFRRSIC